MADEPANDAPPAPAEDAKPDAAAAPAVVDTEGGAKPAEETKPTEDAPADKPEAPAEAETPTDKPSDEATPPATDPKEVARRSYAERQRIKTETQSAVAQSLTPATAEELEQQGYSKEDARFESLRQEMQNDKFASQVADLTANMSMDAQSVETEFDIFNEKSPNFDKDYADRVSREYIRDADVKFDESGKFVLSARVSMYDYYKSRYDDRMAGQKAGQVDGQRSAEKMLASAEIPSSAAPPPAPDKDPIDAGLDEVFNAK